MFHAEEYMRQLIDALTRNFGERLIYVGLQGSYMRGEATESSDIDPMVVIDDICISDLDVYRKIVSTLEFPDLSCGFICGKQELTNWNPLEICHLIHTTKDYYGTLTDLVPAFADTDVRNFVKLSMNNLYHEITHHYIHSFDQKNMNKIVGSYKATFFILQNLHYLETGMFVATKMELMERLTGENAEVLATAIALSNGDDLPFDSVFSLLHTWCKNMIRLL